MIDYDIEKDQIVLEMSKLNYVFDTFEQFWEKW